MTLRAWFLSLTLYVAGCGARAPDEAAWERAATARAGDVRVEAFFDPDPPAEKNNTVWLRVTRDGAPVASAPKVEAMMPEMGTMPEMREPAEVKAAGEGLYRADFDLPMGGGWTLEVTVPVGGTASFGFTVGSRGLVGEEGAPAAAAAITPKPVAFPDPAVTQLRAAFAAIDRARELLAADRLDGLDAIANEVGTSLRAASPEVTAASTEAGAWLDGAAKQADALAGAKDLAAARRAYGELNRHLLALASMDPRLAEGMYVFQCPMTPTFPKWFQAHPTLENPYMGAQMPGCGGPSDWSTLGPAPGEQSGGVRIEESRRQQFGIRTAPVEKRAIAREIRALGQVVWDETALEDVALTVGGYVRRLHVAETGQAVRLGQPLFDLYSPDLVAAQDELLVAIAHRQTSGDALVDAARVKLLRLGLTEAQVAALAATGVRLEAVPILSPVSGWVAEKEIVEGSAFEAGDRLYRVARLDRVWVEAAVYTSDLALVQLGETVAISFPNLDREPYVGTIEQLRPAVDPESHTRTVRIAVASPDASLLPGTYADVIVRADLGERLVVPSSAVIYTGPRRLVFVDAGEGRLVPREIEVGVRSGDVVEVVSGLAEGDRVVASGTFLVAAESRLRSATDLWEAPDDGI